MTEILIFCFVFFGFFIIREVKLVIYHFLFVTKQKDYSSLLLKFLEDSYEVIYRDQMLAYSAEGLTLDRETMETVKRNFIKLSFQLMGAKNEKILTHFYGTREVLIKNMIIYMQRRQDDDQILQFARQKNLENES